MVDRASAELLIADDHPLFRLGLVMALRALGFGRVDEAVDGQHAIDLCRGRRYHAVLLDLRMPRRNGIEAAHAIASMPWPEGAAPALIMLTTFDEPAIVRAAQDVGVAAFMSKETEPEALAVVIDRLLAGERAALTPGAPLPDLTERERQVLLRFAGGDSVKDAAEALGISPETVKDHASRVYAKLGARDRVGALREASRLGLLLDELAGPELAGPERGGPERGGG